MNQPLPGMQEAAQPKKRKTKEERLRELEEKEAKELERYKQRINALRAAKARLEKADRAKDTRRKVLVGAYVLHAWENNQPVTKQGLAQFLTKESDRALFSDLLGS